MFPPIPRGQAFARPSGLLFEHILNSLVVPFSPHISDFRTGPISPNCIFRRLGPFLWGSCVWVYLGNNNYLSSLVRVDSDAAAIAVLVARFWKVVQRHNICVWFSRAKSKINPSDLPTLEKRFPYKAQTRGGFRTLRTLYSHCRSQPHHLTPQLRRPRIPAKGRFRTRK